MMLMKTIAAVVVILMVHGCAGADAPETKPESSGPGVSPDTFTTELALQPLGSGSLHQRIMLKIFSEVERSKLLFDWSMASNALFCSALTASDGNIALGAEFYPGDPDKNTAAIAELKWHLTDLIDERFAVIDANPRLATLYVKLTGCDDLEPLRSSDRIQFIEPKYTSGLADQGVSKHFRPSPDDQADDSLNNNPAFYDQESGLTYAEYVSGFSAIDADIIVRHNINKIYEQHQYYGHPRVGVGVVDNGVLTRDIRLLSHVKGGLSTYGFYSPFGLLNETADGVHPRFYDFFGIPGLIKNWYNHGTRQVKHVFTIAPELTIASARGTTIPVMLLPNQYQGVIDSILTMAEDPTIRIVSLSAGSIITNNELIRAIDYFNSKDKIVVAAGGTSLNVIKSLIGVVFPANLDSVVATTGLVDTQTTDGVFVLGDQSHGGPEVDFVVDHSSSSSETVSTTAAMLGLVWSAKPELTRDQLITIFIESSSNYINGGKPSPVFGWGKVDLLLAYEKAQAFN